MKKYLLVGSLAFIAAVAPACAQSFRAPVNNNRPEAAQRAPAPATRDKVVGAFPRAARGNPLQMLNPRAPQRYRGTPDETVVADVSPTSPQRTRGESANSYVGVILFGLRW